MREATLREIDEAWAAWLWRSRKRVKEIVRDAIYEAVTWPCTMCGGRHPKGKSHLESLRQRPRACVEIVDDAPCGRTATRYNAESKVPFCDEHGGQNPRYEH